MRRPSHSARLIAVICALLCATPLKAGIHRFKPNQPWTRNYGVWRLTHDPTVQDKANYHNIQCWSPNGRYTCYTHWAGHEGPGGKASAEIHVVDLKTGEDRLVDKGISPRWANLSNHLFYAHRTHNGQPTHKTGIAVMRYDADTREKVIITHGAEFVSVTDYKDRWVYGVQYFRGTKRRRTVVRARNRPGSKLEILRNAPNKHAYIHVNPRHPIIMSRAKDPSDNIYGTNRAFYDLDGSNVRQGSVMCELGHQSWSGDGKYLLMGDRQMRGRLWNKPFPSDLEVLSWARCGDICPADRAGRYIVAGDIRVADTRSGDSWSVVSPRSALIWPKKGPRRLRIST